MSEPNRLLGLMNQQPTMANMLRQPEVRPYEFPWYQALPHAVADWWYGGRQTAPQQQQMNNLIGSANPINIPGQAQEAGHTLGTGFKIGSPEMAGIGLLGAGLAVMGMPRADLATLRGQMTSVNNLARRAPDFTARGYHGSPGPSPIASGTAVERTPSHPVGHGGPWISSDRDVASTYTAHEISNKISDGSFVAPVDVRFKNPYIVDAVGRPGSDVPFPGGAPGIAYDTNQLSLLARKKGYDGLVVRNVRDEAMGGGKVSDVYHPLSRGTAFSGIDGSLIYGIAPATGALGAGVGMARFFANPQEVDADNALAGLLR